MTNVLLTNEQAKTLAHFIYGYLNDYIKDNDEAFQSFIFNITKKGMMNNV